jgi:phosphohistidine phosphatase
MDVYLMQHGEARPESEDPQRPLTDRGRQEVERVARHAGSLGLGIALVQHSGKLRARQTAEIVASHLAPPPRVEELPGLGPNDDPEAAARAIQDAAETRLLVGHLPHLAKLASWLLIGDPDRTIVAFRMGGLVGLRRGTEGWRLRFALVPELLPA